MDLLAKQGIASPLRSERYPGLGTALRLVAALAALLGMTGFSYLSNLYPYLKFERSEYEVLSPMAGSVIPSVWAATCLGTILALGVLSFRGLPGAPRPIRSMSELRRSGERGRRLLGFTTFVIAVYFSCVFYFKLWFVATLIEFTFHQESFVWAMNFGETTNPQTIAGVVLLVALAHTLLGAWASDRRKSSRVGILLVLTAGIGLGAWGHLTVSTPRTTGVAWGGFWVRQGAPTAYHLLGRPFLGTESDVLMARAMIQTHDGKGSALPIRQAVDVWFADEPESDSGYWTVTRRRCDSCVLPRSKTTDFAGLTLLLQDVGNDVTHPELALEYSRDGTLRAERLGPDWQPLESLSEVQHESLEKAPGVVLRCDADLPNTLVLDLISSLGKKGAKKLQLASLPIGPFGPGHTLRLSGMKDYFIDGRPRVLLGFLLSVSEEWAPSFEPLADGSCLTKRLHWRLPLDREAIALPRTEADLLSWEEHNYESLFLLLERAAREGAVEVTLWRAMYSHAVELGP